MHEQLRRFTRIMHKLHGWVGGVVSTGANGQQQGAKQGSADEKPADSAPDRQLSKTDSTESAISAQADQGYNPIVSGSAGPVEGVCGACWPCYAAACSCSIAC